MTTLKDEITRIIVIEKLLSIVPIREKIADKLVICFEAIEIHNDFTYTETLQYVKSSIQLPYVFSKEITRQNRIELIQAQVEELIGVTRDGYVKANLIKIRYYLIQELNHIVKADK